MNYNDCLRVGVISSTHGVKGEVKVFPTTDDLDRFKTLKVCYLDTNGREDGLIKLNVEGVKFFKNMAILKFKEYNNINDIEKYRQKDLLVTREDAVSLNEGEFFIYDIIGSKAVDENGTELGVISEILTGPANDVFVLKTGADFNKIDAELRAGKEIENGTEIYLPRIPSCIPSIDTDKKEVKVIIPKGLI